MRVLVTGSSGHLGEALMRSLQEKGYEATGLDLLDSPFTQHVGCVADPDFVHHCVRGIDCIIHSATLHKPHVATHSRQSFIDTNISGTLNLLEAALAHDVSRMVFTSTTSAFGSAMNPAEDQPTAWVTEDLASVPKNIYGVTKVAAEDLCELFFRTRGLPTLVLRTSRFFFEEDDSAALRSTYDGLNLKVNELLHRRVDLEDVVEAHLLAMEKAPLIGFRKYIISATTPFGTEHLPRLRTTAPQVLGELFPEFESLYEQRGWRMLPGLDRVYVNHRAREELGWRPHLDFRRALDRLRRREEVFSPLSRIVGSKGYHDRIPEDRPYPVEDL